MATARSQIVLVPVLMLGSIVGAAAQSQDEQQACTNDAFQFCQMYIPDRDRVFHCLVDNRNNLSAACHNVMAAYAPPDPAPGRATKAKKQPPVTPVKGTAKTTTPAKGTPLKLTPP
jgi:hypothetical protein